MVVAMDWFVDLSTVTRPEQVAGAVRAALGLREEAAQAPLNRVLEVLRAQQALIIMDNCEHLIDACANMADLIGRTCPRIHLLATSRQPLGVDGERVYRLRPLSLPKEGADSLGEIRESEAVQLFAERAHAHDSTFVVDEPAAALVGSICRRLDGVPLAIELAAARLGAMSLADLSNRLDQRFRLPTSGNRTAQARQRTLQAVVDWSFGLLSCREREVLCHLWVFVGGFDLQAAEAVGARRVLTRMISPMSLPPWSTKASWSPTGHRARCASGCWRPSGNTPRISSPAQATAPRPKRPGGTRGPLFEAVRGSGSRTRYPEPGALAEVV